MTAPGNSPLILTLLAAFIACTGYAGGRIHQWYRMGHDRDEAYRDGYDTATRSVFSMAARIISPRARERDRAAIRAAATTPFPAPTTDFVAAEPGIPSITDVPPSRVPAPRHSTPASAPWTEHIANSSGETVAWSTSPDPASSGRHTVPDELVQGPTYRLNPDRVARAKVVPGHPEAAPSTQLPHPRTF
jgi:hypothetical protein